MKKFLFRIQVSVRNYKSLYWMVLLSSELFRNDERKVAYFWVLRNFEKYCYKVVPSIRFFFRWSFWSSRNIWEFVYYCLTIFIFHWDSATIFSEFITHYQNISVSSIVRWFIVVFFQQISTPDFIDTIVNCSICRIVLSR